MSAHTAAAVPKEGKRRRGRSAAAAASRTADEEGQASASTSSSTLDADTTTTAASAEVDNSKDPRPARKRRRTSKAAAAADTGDDGGGGQEDGADGDGEAPPTARRRRKAPAPAPGRAAGAGSPKSKRKSGAAHEAQADGENDGRRAGGTTSTPAGGADLAALPFGHLALHALAHPSSRAAAAVSSTGASTTSGASAGSLQPFQQPGGLLAALRADVRELLHAFASSSSSAAAAGYATFVAEWERRGWARVGFLFGESRWARARWERMLGSLFVEHFTPLHHFLLLHERDPDSDGEAAEMPSIDEINGRNKGKGIAGATQRDRMPGSIDTRRTLVLNAVGALFALYTMYAAPAPAAKERAIDSATGAGDGPEGTSADASGSTSVLADQAPRERKQARGGGCLQLIPIPTWAELVLAPILRARGPESAGDGDDGAAEAGQGGRISKRARLGPRSDSAAATGSSAEVSAATGSEGRGRRARESAQDSGQGQDTSHAQDKSTTRASSRGRSRGRTGGRARGRAAKVEAAIAEEDEEMDDEDALLAEAKALADEPVPLDAGETSRHAADEPSGSDGVSAIPADTTAGSTSVDVSLNAVDGGQAAPEASSSTSASLSKSNHRRQMQPAGSKARPKPVSRSSEPAASSTTKVHQQQEQQQRELESISGQIPVDPDEGRILVDGEVLRRTVVRLAGLVEEVMLERGGGIANTAATEMRREEELGLVEDVGFVLWSLCRGEGGDGDGDGDGEAASGSPEIGSDDVDWSQMETGIFKIVPGAATSSALTAGSGQDGDTADVWGDRGDASRARQGGVSSAFGPLWRSTSVWNRLATVPGCVGGYVSLRVVITSPPQPSSTMPAPTLQGRQPHSLHLALSRAEALRWAVKERTDISLGPLISDLLKERARAEVWSRAPRYALTAEEREEDEGVAALIEGRFEFGVKDASGDGEGEIWVDRGLLLEAERKACAAIGSGLLDRAGEGLDETATEASTAQQATRIGGAADTNASASSSATVKNAGGMAYSKEALRLLHGFSLARQLEDSRGRVIGNDAEDETRDSIGGPDFEVQKGRFVRVPESCLSRVSDHVAGVLGGRGRGHTSTSDAVLALGGVQFGAEDEVVSVEDGELDEEDLYEEEVEAPVQEDGRPEESEGPGEGGEAGDKDDDDDEDDDEMDEVLAAAMAHELEADLTTAPDPSPPASTSAALALPGAGGIGMGLALPGLGRSSAQQEQREAAKKKATAAAPRKRRARTKAADGDPKFDDTGVTISLGALEAELEGVLVEARRRTVRALTAKAAMLFARAE